ncbi:MAG: MBL fold metallo-hydrolase [Clostridiales Family XIII bacterium]|jgi:glyoxylase-like metal-dependent hydrolase (beta-lactamase superfamily II)|nr:MBL fold metallo-hydrolase [Clostridiales Family XIII bacterium]
MIEKIMDDFYRISVPLPKNPLKELNSYFIRGDESDLLIDLGFRMHACRDALESGLAELNSAPERRDILLTHLHADHSGLVNDFIAPGRRIFLSDIDLRYLLRIISGDTRAATHLRFTTEGFPDELLSRIEKTNLTKIYALGVDGARCQGLLDGEILNIGAYRLQTVLVPGHTPGNAMFWMEEQKTMITGDHVLFDITPNITAWVDVEDSLGDYIHSLKKGFDYPVEHSLPSHREPGNYHERVNDLIVHHEHRLEHVHNIIIDAPGLSAYEIASRMKWKIRSKSWDTFPPMQKWFAMGECLSHLDYLRLRKKIYRIQAEHAYIYYPHTPAE